MGSFYDKDENRIYWCSVCGMKEDRRKAILWALVTECQHLGHANRRSLSRVFSLLM